MRGNLLRFPAVKQYCLVCPSQVMRPLLRHALVAAVHMAALAHVQAADLAEPSSPAALEQSVKEFLESFINPHQTPEQQAGFFAEGAEYYGFGPTSRQTIVKDIRRYSARWPMRSYRLLEIEYIKHDPHADDVFVSYTIEFEVANSTERAHGYASYGAAIADFHSTPRIVMIMERIRKREH